MKKEEKINVCWLIVHSNNTIKYCIFIYSSRSLQHDSVGNYSHQQVLQNVMNKWIHNHLYCCVNWKRNKQTLTEQIQWNDVTQIQTKEYKSERSSGHTSKMPVFWEMLLKDASFLSWKEQIIAVPIYLQLWLKRVYGTLVMALTLILSAVSCLLTNCTCRYSTECSGKPQTSHTVLQQVALLCPIHVVPDLNLLPWDQLPRPRSWLFSTAFWADSVIAPHITRYLTSTFFQFNHNQSHCYLTYFSQHRDFPVPFWHKLLCYDIFGKN
jgi:hypothetical protein